MDSALVDMIKQRAAREKQRTQYPEGFPPLPMVPAGRYTDPHFFALEREHVFGKSWMFVAHTSELPTPGTTRYDMHFIGAAPPTDNERDAFSRQIELNLAIFNEDLNTLPSMQRSIGAGVIDSVRFGYQECRLYHLHEEIDRRIGVEQISAPLRVPQVLGAWVES
ncbi:MAG: hypothetical protein HYZ50_06975 [Deltaproteobacteria bacterium]|nr:hypothetical protein [Deltaproteobacteria bacterium]